MTSDGAAGVAGHKYYIPEHKGRRTLTSRPICAASEGDAADVGSVRPCSNLKRVSVSRTFILTTLNHFAFQTK